MNPYDRWDDWELDRAVGEIGREYRNDGDFDSRDRQKGRQYSQDRNSRDFLKKMNGSQKRVILSAFLFLTIVFSANGQDFFSKSVYSIYKTGIDSGNLYTALNSMAKEAIGIQSSENTMPVNASIQEIFYPPVAGAVKVGFQGISYNGELSNGIEIESALGTTVLCPQEGVVLEVSENNSLGRVIRINFGNGWEGILGNFGEINVAQGDPVSMGLKLGTVGISSARQKPWLYLELLKDQQPVNPLLYLIQNK